MPISAFPPCEACKFLRRKCVNGCIFAPYFHYEESEYHFSAIHKVFGSKNASRLLGLLPVTHRCEAAMTISYEALARLQDPVYGCVSHIIALQQQVLNLQVELDYLREQASQKPPPDEPLHDLQSCFLTENWTAAMSEFDQNFKVAFPPCGACKFLRRKCVNGCIFAPYFLYEQAATHFSAIHKVFGATNVSKMLAQVPVTHRCEAAVTIKYEALARLQDPIYGCVSHIIALQQQVLNLQAQLDYLIEQEAQILLNSYATISTSELLYEQPPPDEPLDLQSWLPTENFTAAMPELYQNFVSNDPPAMPYVEMSDMLYFSYDVI